MALIIDTGPLLASLDRHDAFYEPCRRLLAQTPERRIIPAPVLVEVDYWVSQRLHPAAFVALLRNIESGAFAVEDLRPEDYPRVRELCDRYEDVDIGFVDAAVLAIVERFGETKVATLDRRHFGSLKPRHVSALQLLPG